EEAMAAIATLRGPIDTFFDAVTVNDADPAKREARLNLLTRIRAAVHKVADFSRIEGSDTRHDKPGVQGNQAVFSIARAEGAQVATVMTQYVYRFGGGVNDGGKGDKNLLGGKGANLDGMAVIGLPVPPGFTISTPMCTHYYEAGESFPDSLREQVAKGLAHIEGVTGKRFGDAGDPLLVSVRSGARVSMPGMKDTVLNLGLNDTTVEGLAASSGDARFAWDSYRRFI